MLKNKIIKHPWFKPALSAAIFIGLMILIGQIIIFSHPKPLRLYLEFLNKHSQRGRMVSVYSKEEFAKKYLGLDSGAAYRPDSFSKLFQARFNYPPVKENNLFKVYQAINSDNPCQVDIFGVSQTKDLVYVSYQNACLKNGHKN